MVTMMLFTIRDIASSILDEVYILKAENENKSVLKFDLPLRLQEILNYKKGEKLNVILSPKEIKAELTKRDLYMVGKILSRKTENSKAIVKISVGGLILSLEAKGNDMNELKQILNQKLFSKVYILFKRL